MAVAVSLGCAAQAGAETLKKPFSADYAVRSLGVPAGVPLPIGAATLKLGTRNRMLIIGEAATPDAAIYEIGVHRDADGHISGFSGEAREVVVAAFADGGLAYYSDGIHSPALVYSTTDGGVGQIRPDLTTQFFPIDNLAPVPSGLGFVPPGVGGANSLKIVSSPGGQWYDSALAWTDATAAYAPGTATEVPASKLAGGPAGFVYSSDSSPSLGSPHLIVAEDKTSSLVAYSLNAQGDPVRASRQTVLTGLRGPEGAALDAVTNDLLVPTNGYGRNDVLAVRGFANPAEALLGSLPAPTLGKNVNIAIASGSVYVRVRGRKGRQLLKPQSRPRRVPVGTLFDARKGRVAIASSGVGVAGGQNIGTVTGAVFRTLQSRRRGAKGLTELQMAEGGFAGAPSTKRTCGSVGKATSLNFTTFGRVAAKKRPKKVVQLLTAKVKGRFRTRGKYSSATVRGTEFGVRDRCDGTLTVVRRGAVLVRDFRRRKTILVRTGKSYLARR